MPRDQAGTNREAATSRPPLPPFTEETARAKVQAAEDAWNSRDPERVARYGAADRARLLADAGIVRNRLKVDAVIANAQRVLELRESHGSFAGWLDAHHPLPKDEWCRLFRETFRFTGGEIVGEFLLSTGYLPGAHQPDCPVYRRVVAARPPWWQAERAGARAG